MRQSGRNGSGMESNLPPDAPAAFDSEMRQSGRNGAGNLSPAAAFDSETAMSAKELKKAKKQQQKEDKKAAKDEKKMKNKNGKNGATIRELDFGEGFDNPLEDGRVSPGSLGSPGENGKDALSVQVGAGDGIASPLSPRSPMSDVEWEESATFEHTKVEKYEEQEAATRQRRLGRAGMSYFIMTTGTLLLLPLYVMFAVFMAWVYYIVPNPMSALGTAVAVAVPGVLFVGREGGKKSSETQLQFFSFLMVLAITLQISIAIVVALDDGTLVDAYLAVCAKGAREMCANLGDLPVGAEYLPLDIICGCADQEESSDSGGGQDLATCLRFKMEDDLNMGKRELGIAMIVTLVIELLLSWIAWGMMVDLDLREAKKAAKRKGGGPTGTLRGTIVCATDLLSEFDTLPAKKQAKMVKKEAKAYKRQLRQDKKNKSKGKKVTESELHGNGLKLELASRRVELALKTPGLDKAVSHHTKQTARTPEVEDDRDPDYQYAFGGLRTYEASRTIELSVYDFAPKHPVKVGSATVAVEKNKLPDYKYKMDGDPDNPYVRVPLTWTNDKTQETKKAGVIVLELIWVPEGEVVTTTVSMITKTWYFELTVIGMVGLSMLVLAYQSPTQPPPLMALGALQCLEIFCATHMIVEIGMEFSVAAANKRGREQLHDPWFILALIVLACNWLSLLKPSMTAGLSLANEAAVETPQIVSVEGGGAVTQAANNLLNRAKHGDQDFGQRMVLNKLISVGRVFRIVRPIRTLRMIRNVDVIVTVLAESVGLFATVCALLLFLLAVFALVGMSSFGGALQYECIGEPGLDAPMPNCSLEQIASSNLMDLPECPLPCPPTLICANEPNAHMWCAPLEGGRREIGGDRFGYRDFDNFGRGITTMFVQTTGDGGMHTMPIALHEAGCSSDGAAWVISFFGSVCLNLLALNLFLAVCCSAYSDVAARTLIDEMERKHWKETKRQELMMKETDEERIKREELEAQNAKNLTIAQQIEQINWVEKGSKCASVRESFKNNITSIWFERFTSLVIVGNTITMAMVHEGMDSELKETLKIFEAAFLVCFILEATFRMIGNGTTLYWASPANKLDVIVIVCSIAGFVVQFFESEVRDTLGLNPESIASLRAVRLLRALQVVRLLQRQKALLVVLRTIFRAWKPLLIHSFFCVFSMAMFSIIGMHVFGGALGPLATIEDYDAESNANFETFGRGFLTVFEMTVGEDWSHTMYWYTRFASLGHNFPEAFVQMTFMLMYVWMNCILFSLCVAMLLENFAIPEEDKLSTQKRMYDRKERAARRKRRKQRQSALMHTLKESEAKGGTRADDGQFYDQLVHASHGSDLDVAENKSLYMFKLNSKLRLGAARVQQHPMFGRVIMVLILLSCVSLALEGPGEGSSGWIQDNIGFVFNFINGIVLGAFILEGVLKSTIHGFAMRSGPTDPYLGSAMNRLDFLIVVLCLISYLPNTKMDGTWAKALRLGRVVTPMINLSKNPEIRLVFISFVRAGPDTLVVLLPLILMLLVFSILGVANFGSLLKACVMVDDPLRFLSSPHEHFNNATGEMMLLQLNQTFCEESPDYDWVNLPFNFDDALIGTATLLVALTDGAHDLMLITTESSDVAKVFWVMFHMCFTCFFLNLFIGVLSASFEKSSGASLMSLGEKQWEAVRRTMSAYRPSKNDGDEERPVLGSSCLCMATQPVWWFQIRNTAYKLSHNKKLEHLWRFGIMANTTTLATDMYPIGNVHVQVVDYLNLTFLTICTAEVVLKLTGFGFKTFFSDGWLISDLILVSVSLFLRISGAQSGVEVLRVMRVFRMIVLASKLPALVALIETLISCLRASAALLLITCLIIYLYSIIGMNLFGLLPEQSVLEKAGLLEEAALLGQQPEDFVLALRQSGTIFARVCPDCTHLTDYSNFSNFPHSFRLLLQVALGQEIGAFTIDMQYLGANFWDVFIFFSTFYIVTVWVCINLFIVTVLTNFDKATISGMEGDAAIQTVDFDGFAHTWASLTIGVHGSRPVEKMEPDLLENLTDQLQKEAVQRDEVETLNVEATNLHVVDGDPALSGTLKVHIKRLTDVAEDDERVYCKMTAFGPATQVNLQTLSTPTRNVRSGVASWQQKHVHTELNLDGTVNHDNVVNADGCCLRIHVTGHHTHLDFDVLSAYQFSDNRIGAETIDMDEIREAGKLDMEFKLMADSNVNSSPPAGEMNRWVRYVHIDDDDDDDDNNGEPLESGATEEGQAPVDDAAAQNGTPLARMKSADLPTAKDSFDDNEDEDDEDDDPNRELTKDEKRAMKIEELQSKKEEKMRKKAAKASKKAAKRLAKAEKKQRKLDKKAAKKAKQQGLTEPEPEPESEPDPDPEPHRFHREGWETSGAVLHVTFEYEPLVAVQKKSTFMDDYTVRYLHKENNCGVEGWLEVSENGGHFERRFCYLQQAPAPCMKIALGCSSIDALESKASRGTLDVHNIPGNQMLSIYANHDVKAKSAKRKDVSFQLVATESADTDQLEQAQIAILSGVVVCADSLKASSGAGGSVLIEEVMFDASRTPVGTKRLDDEDEDGDDDADADLATAEKCDVPVRYMCTMRVRIHRGCSLDSDHTGFLKKGQVATATHIKRHADGTPSWLHISEGWINATLEGGLRWVAIPDDHPNKFFRAVKKIEIGGFVEASKSRVDMKRGNGKGLLKPGYIVEALEMSQDPETGLERIRLRDGWIGLVDPNMKATVDTYCTIEAVPAEDAAPPTDQAASHQSKTFEDSIIPQWNSRFNLKVFSSSTRLVVRVFNSNSRVPQEIGQAVLVLGEDNIPGPTLSGVTLEGSPQSLSIDPVEVKVTLETGLKDHRVNAGSVTLLVAYFQTVSLDELMQARSKHPSGDLCTAMMAPAREENTYRFRAMSSEIKREWLAALRWVANDCQGAYVPGGMPSARIFDDESLHIEHDISTLDLPFSRATLLYRGLYERRVIGSHKPTRRRLMYALFNLETFSWTVGQQQASRQKKKRKTHFDGLSLKELRGLNFHLCLERLVLLHYGKHRCLSFDRQMHEYKTEIQHIALHVMSSALAWWVIKSRHGKTVNGIVWPWHTAWRKCPNAYQIAAKGLVASRLRSLRILKKEVDRRSRPALIVSTAMAF
jgi:hypothetical protein